MLPAGKKGAGFLSPGVFDLPTSFLPVAVDRPPVLDGGRPPVLLGGRPTLFLLAGLPPLFLLGDLTVLFFGEPGVALPPMLGIDRFILNSWAFVVVGALSC